MAKFQGGAPSNDTLVGGPRIDTASYSAATSGVTVSLLSQGLTAADITDSATQVYNPDNGHIYEFVDTVESWSQAAALAGQASLAGSAGHLVTVTSADENQFVFTNAVSRVSQGYDGASIWLGASDTETEGDWIWVTGPETGTVFWRGAGPDGLYGPAGFPVAGAYSNWRAAGYDAPNTVGGDGELTNADYAHMLLNDAGGANTAGAWEDDIDSYGAGSPSRPGGNGYVIEYDGGSTQDTGAGFDTLASIENLIWSRYDDTLTGNGVANVLTGGSGNDTLSGRGGIDALKGGTGHDQLKGGIGSDAFYVMAKRANSDLLIDFASGQDKLVLSSNNFNSDLVPGLLDPAHFAANATGRAEDLDDRFIFDTFTGELFFDGNGSEIGHRYLVATIAGPASDLQATDVIIG